MTRWRALIHALLVLALVWTAVWGVRAFANSRKITAERIQREVSQANFADWSDSATAPDPAEAARRDKLLLRIAKSVNRLDFQEREIHRRNRTDNSLFQKLSPQEKERYVDRTVMDSMNRFLDSLEAMPEKQRKRFIEQGLKDAADDGEGGALPVPKNFSAEMLSRINPKALRAMLEGATPETKLMLAPFMEVFNEAIQGLRGNQFGPRHNQ